MKRGIWTAYLLAAGLLCGAAPLAFAQAPAPFPSPAPSPVPEASPSPENTPAPCFNCASPRVIAAAAAVWSSSDATQTQTSVLGLLHAEAPVTFGNTTLGRACASFSFMTIPGAAVPAPGNYNSFEGELCGKRWFSQNFGLEASVWVNQKLNAASQTPTPLQPATYGWGVGVVGRAADSYVSVLVGQDNYAGSRGGVQVRARAKLAIPQTSVKGGPPIGSVYVDARLSLVSAPTTVVVVTPAATPTPAVLTSTILYGVMIDATSIWGALFPAKS